MSCTVVPPWSTPSHGWAQGPFDPKKHSCVPDGSWRQSRETRHITSWIELISAILTIQVEAHTKFLTGHSPSSQEDSYQAEDKPDTKQHMNLALLLQYPQDRVPVQSVWVEWCFAIPVSFEVEHHNDPIIECQIFTKLQIRVNLLSQRPPLYCE